MPPFEGQLTDEQIQALAEFVFENRSRVFPASPSAPPPPQARLADVLAVGVEVDHDVRDRDGEALPRLADDAALQPARAALGVRRDDDLVRAERAERVLDRLQRAPSRRPPRAR